MEVALINNDSLILCPIGYNIRMINSELEDLDVSETINPQSYTEIPIHFSDGLTHLLLVEKEIPQHDPKYHNVGNFTWEIIKENDVPIKVKLTYPIIDKTLDEVKYIRKQEVKPERQRRENQVLTLIVNNTEVQVSTSREERLLLTSKLSSSSGTYNYKFLNTWLGITQQELQYIISEIDSFVQQAYDWELLKLQEIDACETIDDVYNVKIHPQPTLIESENNVL